MSREAGNAVVTGGAGFIGSHLVDSLLEDGWSVTVLDNLSTGRKTNLAHLCRDSRLRMLEIDLRNSGAVRKAMKGCDAVFHMAAHADIRASLSDRRADLEHNVVGTLNIIEGMIAHNVSDLVFASTSAVYGEASLLPTPEEYAPLQTSLYGASKLACEAFAQAYTKIAPIRFWAYRFANVIGERCRRGVIWDFVHKLTQNPKELEILGNGKQSKEYLYVKDCVNGIMLGYKKAAKDANIFNLGTREQTLVDEVARIVMRQMGLKNVRKRYTGGRAGWIGDNPVVELSLEKIKNLGWRQEVSSKVAIEITTKWALQEIQSKFSQ